MSLWVFLFYQPPQATTAIFPLDNLRLEETTFR